MSTKLSAKTIRTIKQALLCATVTKNDELLIDSFGISAISPVTNIMIIQPMPDAFEFKAMGIGRVPELRSRLNLIIDDPTLTAEFDEPELEPGSGNVYRLVFKTKKTKVEFRCTKPDRIKTKKQVNDPVYFVFDLGEEAAKFMTSGCQAMGVQAVTFYLNEDAQIILKIIDKEKDVLEHVVTDVVSSTKECDTETFSWTYSVPKLAPLLKTSDSTKISITRRGAMKMDADGFTIYLVPEID